MNHDRLQQLAVGYALHALEPDEERELLEHLPTCADCRALIDDTHALTSLLTETGEAEHAPPAGLRDRIVAAAQAEADSGTDLRVESDPFARVSEPLAPATPSPRHVATGTSQTGRGDGRRLRRIAVRSRVLVGVAAAALAVAIAVPVTLATADRSGDGGAGSTLAQALLQPGARELTLSGKAGGSAKAVVGGDGVILLAAGLPANDTSAKTYVLWANDGSGVKPIATFDAKPDKTVQLAVQKLPFDAKTVSFVAVSIEQGRKAPRLPSDIVLASPA